MNDENTDPAKVFAALANPKRCRVLEWLRDPEANFPPQREGDLLRDGVCVSFIADRLGVKQPTASEHMRVLHAAGLVTPRRIKQWTFYRRDEAGIARVRHDLLSLLSERPE